MKHSIRGPLALLALAALSACSPGAPTSQTAAAPATATAETAPAKPAQSTATTQAYALSMANVEAYFEAQKQLALAAQGDPSLEDLSMNLSREDSAQYAARLEANAKVRAIIDKAGLSTRDFALTGETLMSALMAQAALESGMLKELPAGLDPAAVEFVKQNKTKIEALMGSVASAGQ